MNFRDAINSDVESIKNLLIENELPSSDVEEHIRNFILAEYENKIIAVGGIERYGTTALLRSIAVTPEYRGNGIAKKLYQLFEKKASSLGVDMLYLLTESAVEYFKKNKFLIKERASAPESIKNTKQFKELCPSSAVTMLKKLAENN